MEKVILIHGSGHKAASWNETVSRLDLERDGFPPRLPRRRPVPRALLPAAGERGQLPQSPRRFWGVLRPSRRPGPPVRPLSGRHFSPGLHAGTPGDCQNTGADRHAPQGSQGGLRPPERGVPPSSPVHVCVHGL